MSNRAISAIGFLLGVAGGAVGITLGLRAIQNHRYPDPEKGPGMKTIARIAAATILTSGLLVACGNSSDACAATLGNQPKPPVSKPYRPTQPKPGQKRTTSKVQDQPKKAAPKPTNWGGYNDRVNKRNWSQPYRKGMPVAPQPVIIHQYGSDYRTYPGYSGYYPVGIWPVGYGARYGCSAEREDTPAPTPTATVTVTATPTPTPEPTR